ncbi:hypothetical protein [Mesorhizobium sp. M0520]|uniref:hypothetical protein n=1 Tax=Mesorhizobium sp. M0520 TaxID=2956957 RepID=UPI00333CA36F
MAPAFSGNTFLRSENGIIASCPVLLSRNTSISPPNRYCDCGDCDWYLLATATIPPAAGRNSLWMPGLSRMKPALADLASMHPAPCAALVTARIAIVMPMDVAFMASSSARAS